MQVLPDLESGGVERGTLEVGAFLSGEGHRSLVVSSGGRMVPRLVREGTRHVRLPVGEKGPGVLRAFSPLRDLILEEKVDILHLRSRVPAWLALAVVRTLPPWKRPRVVTTFHGFYSSKHFSSVMVRGERVIAISRFIADLVRRTYHPPGARIRVIHRGYDAAVFDPARVSPARVESLKRQWGLPPDPGPVILLVGRITRWKGQARFLDALAGIRDLPWTAVLAGDPAENPDFAAYLKFKAARLGLADRVLFPGLCEDVPAAFLASDLAVSASTRPEAFGRVSVEAQAMGRPVAATSCAFPKLALKLRPGSRSFGAGTAYPPPARATIAFRLARTACGFSCWAAA